MFLLILHEYCVWIVQIMPTTLNKYTKTKILFLLYFFSYDKTSVREEIYWMAKKKKREEMITKRKQNETGKTQCEFSFLFFFYYFFSFLLVIKLLLILHVHLILLEKSGFISSIRGGKNTQRTKTAPWTVLFHS